MCLSDSGARGFFLSELTALSMFYIITDSDPVTCPLIDMSNKKLSHPLGISPLPLKKRKLNETIKKIPV